MKHGAISDDQHQTLYEKHGMHIFRHPGEMSESLQHHVLAHPKDDGDDLGVVLFTNHDSVLLKALDKAVTKKDVDIALSIAGRNSKPHIQKRMFDEGSHFMIGPLNRGNPTADQLHSMHRNLTNHPYASWFSPDISDRNLGTMHDHTLKEIAGTTGVYSNQTLDKVNKEIHLRKELNV